MIKQSKIKKFFKNKKTIVAIVVLLALVFVSQSLVLAYSNKIIPKTFVGNQAIGGMSADRARQLVFSNINQVNSISIVVDNGESQVITAPELGIQYDVDKTVDEAFSLGKKNSWFAQVAIHFKSLFLANKINPILIIDQEKLQKTLTDKIYKKYESDAQEVDLDIKQGVVSIIPGAAGLILDKAELESSIINRFQKFSQDTISLKRSPFEPKFTADDAKFAQQQAQNIISSNLVLTVNDQEYVVEPSQLGGWIKVAAVDKKDVLFDKAIKAGAIKAGELLLVDIEANKVATYVENLAKENINKEAKNSKVRFNEGKVEVFEPSANGIKVKEMATVEAIVEALREKSFSKNSAVIAIAYEQLEPKINENSLSNAGIKELIGRATTNYSTSPANRKHNISQGATSITGTILAPGEEFSAVESLGDVSAATGYLPELVISNNELERHR